MAEYGLAASKYVLILASVVLIVRCIRSMLSDRYEPEIWGYLRYGQTNYTLTHWENIIGRSLNADVRIVSPGVSRVHAVLRRGDKGRWRVYDIFSIFPFDNFLVIEEMDGDKVRMLMEFFAKTRGQVLSNVSLHIDGDSVKECLIGGKPIDDNRKYVVATIDFLYQGGDNLYPLKYSNWMVETHKKLMDIFIEYIQNLTAQGKKIEKSKDNRLIVENKKK